MNKALTYLLLLIGILFLGTDSFAQGVTITGTITTKKNKQPLTEAKVTIAETQQTTTVNKNGKFEITNVKEGTYTLAAFSWGLQTLSKKVTVTNQPVTVDFELEEFEEQLNTMVVKVEKDNDFGITRLKSVEGTAIYAGKKNEVIVMDDMSANLATNNSRQIYAKVAGLNIWESDGAGIQLGIGGRGLNPNRVSNFNTRQNGYDISADALGYPESYYSPPSEALERIEIIRGAASLQYGTQFGGLINFKLKDAPKDKELEVVSRQTVGSFGLFNTFNSVGGTKGKFSYYTYYQFKTGNGWRPNSQFDAHTAFGKFKYQATKKLSLSFEYTYMNYLAHQPGGLSDQLFEDDPRQSIRERNWFRVNWNLAALKLNYKINDQTELDITNFGLIAGRDAMGHLGVITRTDPIDERDLLSDDYKNFGSEARLIRRYEIFNEVSAFLIGSRYYKGFTNRKQGNADAGSGSNFRYLNPDNLEHSEYDFPSENVAVFSENLFQISKKLSVTPGLRFEYINTNAEGYFKTESRDLAGNILFQQTTNDNRSNSRSFVLAGIGTSYKMTKHIESYGNLSQNYRSINFNDMRIVNPNFRVDPNLKDESGYSADLGIRGNVKKLLNFDLSLFLLKYNDRIGEVLQTDSLTFIPYRLRTNISDSRNIGIESFVELNISSLVGVGKSKNQFSVFSNFSWMDARYINSQQVAFEDKEVELVPPIVFKTGLTYKRESLKVVYQYSYTSEHFTDATNAKFTSNAVNGIIPEYYIMDLSAQYTFKRFSLFAGINNLTNNIYFTRRASGYPGPGILPADGRNFYTTIQIKI